MNRAVGKDKVGAAGMPGLEAPGQIPIVKSSILRRAPGVVIVHVGTVVDRNASAGVVIAAVGLDPTITIIRPVARLVEEVVMPADDNFADHEGIRQAIGDGRDVKTHAFSIGRYHGRPEEHAFGVAGRVYAAAILTIGTIG